MARGGEALERSLFRCLNYNHIRLNGSTYLKQNNKKGLLVAIAASLSYPKQLPLLSRQPQPNYESITPERPWSVPIISLLKVLDRKVADLGDMFEKFEKFFAVFRSRAVLIESFSDKLGIHAAFGKTEKNFEGVLKMAQFLRCEQGFAGGN